MTRVVLISLDSFGPGHLRSDLTPCLWALAAEGGYAPDGGRCDLPSVTYPSHASMLSGRRVGNHGVRTGRAGAPAPGTIPGWAGEMHVAAPTLFELCAAAGLSTAAVMGDQKLFQILNADTATSVWPPSSKVPDGVQVDRFGYATNAAIHQRALSAVSDERFAFVFAHYNETDTVGHIYGPEAPETLVCYATVDRMVGEIAASLSTDWDETVLIVLSDHGMELLPERRPFNLFDELEIQNIVVEAISEAGAALLRLRDSVDGEHACEVVARIGPVASCQLLADGVILVAAREGIVFGDGTPPKGIKAAHGGPTTTKTLALVSGGHKAVGRIADAIRQSPPHLTDWAPTIAGLLDLDPSGMDGRDLNR